jgi:lipopolysaccharide transport system ATP-binding protein
MKPIIRVSGLGKQYRIGRHEAPYATLRESIAGAARGSVDRIRRIFDRAGNSGTTRDDLLWALRDVDFEIEPCEVVGVIGRNGAGKSTLLKILSRVTEPTTGRVELYGRVGSLLEVGTGFHPELTGRENIFLNGAILGMGRREIARKLDEIIAFAEIEKFADTAVKRYSSGMYTRLAFAVAAHLEPDILIIDEVLAVGDAQFQKKCLGKIGEVARHGRTVLFVSHNMVAVQRLCNRAILLTGGRLAKVGTVTEVTNHYLDDGEISAHQWCREKPAAGPCYFESVSLRDEQDRILSVIGTSGCLRIRLEFVVGERHPGLMVSVGLLDQFGEQIFGTTPQDGGESAPEARGRYIYTAELPADILMPKTYAIRAALWDPCHGVYDFVDGIRFQAMELASLANSTPGGRLGILAVRCAWRAERDGF